MRWCLGWAIALAAAGAAAAQPPRDGPPSHVRIEPAGDIDPAKLFADRLNQLRSRTDLPSLLKLANKNGYFDFNQIRLMLENNPELRAQALEKLKGFNLNDPQLSGLIAQVARQNNMQLDPDVVQQLLKTLQSELQSGNTSAAPQLRPPLVERPGAFGTTPIDPAAEARRQEWAREIVDWANRFPKDRLAGPLRDSPALRKLMDEIAGSVRNGRPSGEGLDVQLSRWQQRWESLKDWLPKDLPSLRNFSPPEMHLPSLDLNISAPVQSAAPVLGTIAELLPVLYVAMGVLVVFVLLRLLRVGRSAAPDFAAALGPWPVAPGSVDSRSQLIRAFDYLAQLRLGPRAKSWHHRTIADRLPRDAVERQAADELASLYEWARYSPEEGEPSPATVASARTSLSRLAEGAP